MDNKCPFCNKFVYNWHSCDGKHRSDLVKAEYITMGWIKEPKQPEWLNSKGE